MPFKKKFLVVLFLVVLFISGFIRCLQVRNFNSPFTYDQARDMLDLRVIAGFYDFQLSGPTTSITGLNLGPYYYYFNLPVVWIGQGNPQFLVYWNILWFLLAGLAIFLFFYKRNVLLGFFISVFFLMAPQLFGVTRYFWNANSVIYFVVFYFLSLWNYLENKTKKNALIFGISAGLVIQFEAAFGSMCLAFSILVVILSRKKNVLKNYLIGLLPWFLPQIALEIKHNFRMSRLFLGTLNGTNQVLGEKIPLEKVFVMHWKTIISYFEGQFMVAYGLGFILLLGAILIILINKKYRHLGLILLSFIIFALFYYTVIYHHELKMWYLEGVRVWYCFVLGLAVVSIIKYKKIFYILLIVFLIRSFYFTIIDQSRYFTNNSKSDDPKNMANLIKNIDWVYEKVEGDGFSAYNYVPEVYDYPSQYLYWWYGRKKYNYMPEKVSYSLTEVPEYFKLSAKFYQNSRLNVNEKIALIYERKSTYSDWLGQFSEYCVLDKWETEWMTTVEIREKCNK